MKITFLGTGTSQGIPVIGCQCEVCTSADPRDKRLRTSAFVEIDGLHLAFDVGPDFRQQMLRANVSKLDAILMTHEHNDHIVGVDDVRPFNFKQGKDMPIYGVPRVLEELKTRFAYIFDDDPYPGAPRIDLKEIDPGNSFNIKGVKILPISVMHGRLPVLGFRIRDFVYITDAKIISAEERNKVRGCPVLVLNALHHRPHYSHLNLSEALEMVDDLKPGRAYFTHISHNMGKYLEVESSLPPRVHLAYDELTLTI